MTTNINEVAVGSLGDVNVGLAATVPALNALSAQLDAAIAFALGPLQSDLAAALDAALGAQAQLSITLVDPIAYLRQALQAVLELSASLTAALSLPPLVLPIPEIAASASIAAALSAKLGTISALIDAAIAVKIPAARLAAGFSLDLGEVVLLSFDGISDPTTLATIGGLIDAKFNAGIGGGAIGPFDRAAGIIMVVKSPAVFAALSQIVQS